MLRPAGSPVAKLKAFEVSFCRYFIRTEQRFFCYVDVVYITILILIFYRQVSFPAEIAF